MSHDRNAGCVEKVSAVKVSEDCCGDSGDCNEPCGSAGHASKRHALAILAHESMEMLRVEMGSPFVPPLSRT